MAVEVTSDATVASVECFYRRTGAASPPAPVSGSTGSLALAAKPAEASHLLGFAARQMAPSDTGLYSVTIPATEFGSDGLVYRVRVTDIDGRIAESEEVRVESTAAGFATLAACPNPLRSSTTITYGVPHPQRVSLGIFSVSGVIVRRLTGERRIEAGRHSLVWDGLDDAGRAVPSGVYYLRARGQTFRADRAVTVLR